MYASFADKIRFSFLQIIINETVAPINDNITITIQNRLLKTGLKFKII